MEINFREVKDDLLKEWLDLREENGLAYLNEEDKKHSIDFDEIGERVLRNVPDMNKNYVKKQLEYLERKLID